MIAKPGARMRVIIGSGTIDVDDNGRLVPANTADEGVPFNIRPALQLGELVLIDHDLERAARADDSVGAVAARLAPLHDHAKRAAALVAPAQVADDLANGWAENLGAPESLNLIEAGHDVPSDQECIVAYRCQFAGARRIDHS